MRPSLFLLLGFLISLWALGQDTSMGNGEGVAPSPPSPSETVLSPERGISILEGTRASLKIYLEGFTERALAQALHRLVTEKKIRVRMLLPKEAFTNRTSYAMGFAFLALRYPNLEVKVLGGGKVDPRIIGDSSWMLVGYPLEGIPPEVKGPLLLVTAPDKVKSEENRFDLYWQAAPYCRPRARYQEPGFIQTWCELSYRR